MLPPDRLALACWLVAWVGLGCATELPTEFKDATLYGAVTDLRGLPVPGARIHVSGRTALSDSHGRFRVSRLEPGLASIRFEAPGFLSATEELHVSNRALYLQVQLVSVAEKTRQALAALDGRAMGQFETHLVELEAFAPADPRTAALVRLRALLGEPDGSDEPDGGP